MSARKSSSSATIHSANGVSAHTLIGMQFGPVQVGVSAGYLRDRALKDGVYTSLDVRTVF